MRNSENHRFSYVVLVGALRSEFNPTALEALWIQMREHRYDTSSLGVLAQAIHDAQDITYDTGHFRFWGDQRAEEGRGDRVIAIEAEQGATATRPSVIEGGGDR